MEKHVLLQSYWKKHTIFSQFIPVVYKSKAYTQHVSHKLQQYRQYNANGA
jgi:hypothetical protein